MNGHGPLFAALPWLSPAHATALVLGLACVLAAWRSLRDTGSTLATWPWRALRVGLQAALATLLYFTLWPPPGAPRPLQVVVATAGATAPVLATGERLVALPEAPALPGALRVPDLAGVLARWPGARVRVVGWGLGARDRAVARGHVVAFTPVAVPAGITALQGAQVAPPGALVWVRGRVQGVPGARVRLRDPAGQVAGETRGADDGTFALPARVRDAGLTRFALEWLDARGQRRERLVVPIAVHVPAPLRVWILAGAPTPDTNQLRRWAEQTGMAVSLRAALGGGVVLADQPMPLTAAALARVDVLIIDPRAWAGLDATSQRSLADAVRAGMGLLLRVDGPVPPATRAQWQHGLGLSLHGDGHGERVQLQPGDPPMVAWQLALAGDAAVPLLAGREGRVLAAWQALGRGRVALWTLDGSFARVLAGHGTRYADDWSRALGAVARADTVAVPRLQDTDTAWRDERVVACGLAAGARWQDPAGALHALAVDARGCAAFWPSAAGPHRVFAAGTATGVLDVQVRDPREAAAMRASELGDATRALLALGPRGTLTHAPRGAEPGRRWPWFLAWLAVFALVGGLERRTRPA
jgi:hypothetical protein